MKGIILAGGAGTRLFPLTQIASKQLMPVYDKPMIYYPLSTLMLMGIRDVLIISTPQDTPRFKNLLSNGNELGINISYKVQEEPKGIAEVFIIGKEFIENKPTTLILGDNIFYGHGYLDFIKQYKKNINGALIFGYYVSDPERYGVVDFDSSGKVLSIEEKPLKPKSNYAVPGLYLYDHNVVQYAEQLNYSNRGELEITDLNNLYLLSNQLHVHILNRGVAWLDTGTHKSLLEAGSFIETIESRQGLKIGCIEEIAFANNYISRSELISLVKKYPKNNYRYYLEKIINE